MKKDYLNPDIAVIPKCVDDILLLSDTFVDVGGLWEDDEESETPAE